MAEIIFHYPGVVEKKRIEVEGDIQVRQGLDDQGWVRYEVGSLPCDAQADLEAAMAGTIHAIHGVEAQMLALVKFNPDERGVVRLQNGTEKMQDMPFGLLLQSTIITLAPDGVV